jgi:hypothetical protein
VIAAQLGVAVIGTTQCTVTVYRKAKDFPSALRQTVSVYLLAAVGYAWCVTIPHKHPRLVIFTLGSSFAHITCKMIVAAMSRTKYSAFQPVLLPLPLLFLVTKLELLPRHDDVLLGVYTAISCYSMAAWVSSAMEEIAVYIGVRKFHLGPRPTKRRLAE